MGKFDEQFEICEQLFVTEGLLCTEIKQQTGVSLTTLTKWKRNGNWEEKRLEHVAKSQTLKAMLEELKLKLAKEALASGEPQKVYALAAILKIPTTATITDIENPEPTDKEKGLSMELVEQIRKRILGVA